MKARRVSRAFCFGCRATPIYLEMRSCERTVPICWKVVIIWLAVVSITNFPSLAQFLNSADSGSPPVFTWMVYSVMPAALTLL